MKLPTMISPSKRKNLKCHFCGSDQSVKYQAEIPDPITNEPRQISCCNRCYFLAAKMMNPVGWKTLTGAEQVTMNELCEKEQEK